MKYLPFIAGAMLTAACAFGQNPTESKFPAQSPSDGNVLVVPGGASTTSDRPATSETKFPVPQQSSPEGDVLVVPGGVSSESQAAPSQNKFPVPASPKANTEGNVLTIPATPTSSESQTMPRSDAPTQPASTKGNVLDLPGSNSETQPVEPAAPVQPGKSASATPVAPLGAPVQIIPTSEQSGSTPAGDVMQTPAPRQLIAPLAPASTAPVTPATSGAAKANTQVTPVSGPTQLVPPTSQQ